MSSMFTYATNFSGNISGWNTSAVTNISSMFSNAEKFNSDISAWNTSKVINMGYMFMGAHIFNQDLSGWNVQKVNSFYAMFSDAGNFNQNLGKWNIVNGTYNMSRMFDNSAMDCMNYSKTLAGWSSQNVSGGSLGAKNLIYGTAGKVYRDQLIAKGWSISGDFYDDSCTGVILGLNDTAGSASALTIYPNPVKDILNIKTSDKILAAQIYNLNGQLVTTFNSDTSNVSGLAKGVYLVKVTTDKGIVSKKIIKE